jgi:hypothetical protein
MPNDTQPSQTIVAVTGEDDRYRCEFYRKPGADLDRSFERRVESDQLNAARFGLVKRQRHPREVDDTPEGASQIDQQ